MISLATIGMKRLVYAIMNEEDETYGPVKIFAKAIDGNIAPATNSATNFADDGAVSILAALGDIPVTFTQEDLATSVQADVLGHTIDSNGVLIKKFTDKAPYVAIGFMSEMSNGKFMFIWLYKGIFQVVTQAFQTKNDQPAFQNPQITASFIRRDRDDAWQASFREDDSKFPGADVWFNAVYEPNVDTEPPTVTVSPDNEATDVSVDAPIVWTFDKALSTASVNQGVFLVINADGEAVVGTLSISSDKTVVTFTPSDALEAGTTYLAMATQNVKSISGYTMTSGSITKFETVEEGD